MTSRGFLFGWAIFCVGVSVGTGVQKFWPPRDEPELREVTNTLGSQLTDCRSALEAAGVVGAKIGQDGSWDLSVRTLSYPDVGCLVEISPGVIGITKCALPITKGLPAKKSIE